MAKKDINFIKHIRPQVKKTERDMQDAKITTRMRMMRDLEIRTQMSYDENTYRNKEICKSAAKMSSRERLMNYAATGNGTYLGVNCNWDMLTKMGRDKFGRLIGSIFG